MKKSKVETAETRKRIVEIAAKAFRKQGIEATGVAQIMATAGLSHGGFYRHFESKDQLVTEALSASQKNLLRDALAAADKGGDAMLDAFSDYMTSSHRDDREDGCPLTAMGSELVRASEDTRHAATESFRKLVETMTPFMRQQEDEEGFDLALSVMTNMIGAVTIARMVDDPVLSDRILATIQRRVSRSMESAPAKPKRASKKLEKDAA